MAPPSDTVSKYLRIAEAMKKRPIICTPNADKSAVEAAWREVDDETKSEAGGALRSWDKMIKIYRDNIWMQKIFDAMSFLEGNGFVVPNVTRRKRGIGNGSDVSNSSNEFRSPPTKRANNSSSDNGHSSLDLVLADASDHVIPILRGCYRKSKEMGDKALSELHQWQVRFMNDEIIDSRPLLPRGGEGGGSGGSYVLPGFDHVDGNNIVDSDGEDGKKFLIKKQLENDD